MSTETKQVLEMLTEGKITAEDAEKLLDKLAGRSGAPTGTAGAANGATTASGAGGGKPRFLRILVERPGHDQVNIRVPISMARTSKLMALIPPRVCERLAEQGIDLGRFASMAELTDALETTDINIDKGNGKRVRIFCE